MIGLESCLAAVSRQIRHIRAQRRPRPGHLQRQIDQLLWRCCRQLPLDRFQDVYDTVADPLSDLHLQIRCQAMVRHGQVQDVFASLNRRMRPPSSLKLLRWSSRLQDLSLFYEIWSQQSEAIRLNAEMLWRLASDLSGRREIRSDVLADILSMLANHDHGERLAQFLYDCILRHSCNAGFEAGAQLRNRLQERIGSSRLAAELGLLLIQDQRCCQD